MSSFISSDFPARAEILTAFSQNLNIPIEAPGDASKVLGIVEKILTGSSLASLQPPLAGTLGERVTALQSMLQSCMDSAAERALRGEMKGLLEKKVAELKSLVSKESQVELIQKIQKALPEIPPHSIASFVSTVDGFYGKALLEGKALKEALTFALGKGMVRSLVSLPSVDEIAANEELQEKIEADLEFKPYTCVIDGDLVISDGVYLREDAAHNPRERYHDKAIRDWIAAHHTDPVDRSPKSLADIKPDHKGREFVESKLWAMLYPELSIGASVPAEVAALRSKSFVLALGAAYPLIKEKYEEALSQPQDLHILVVDVESSIRDTLDRFTSLVEGMNFEGEEVAVACFPVIKGFLRQAESKLTGENLGEVREEFVKKLGILVPYFHEIESASDMSAFSKEKAVKMVGEAIGEGASLEDVMRLFEAQLAAEKALLKQEDELREDFPGCLLGDSEWTTHLGVVEKVPLPEGMYSILSGPCSITPDKKVGETHILVLIPETVDGHPLTLNSLGSLLKSNGHFSNAEDGYSFMDLEVSTQHGNKPVGGAHYVLMTKDLLPESRNKSYIDQQAMVMDLSRRSGAVYEVPSALPVAVGALLNYLTSGGTRLVSDDPRTYTRCQEKVYDRPVLLGGFSSEGLEVEHDHEDCHWIGVAALRKF